jgi:DNA repair photolyase
LYKLYNTKHILNVHKHCDGGWFWIKYSASPYLGCEYGCSYCYCRDEKYDPHKYEIDPDILELEDPFSEYIKIKENAPELFRKAISKKPIDLIYLDNYQPVEKEYQYSRQILRICLDIGLPVFINEKSPLLLRDLDILNEINNKSYVNVGWSIISSEDNKTFSLFEPNSPTVESRFNSMKLLSDNNILTGTVFMPIFPYIYDSEENIEEVIKNTKENGGKYILDGGLTLNGYCKKFFYKYLEKYDSSLIEKYEKVFSNEYLYSQINVKIHKTVVKYCNKYNVQNYITRPISFFPQELQINKRVSENLYIKAREIQLTAGDKYKEWAYRKAAREIDGLQENIRLMYQNEGTNGLTKIKGVGKSIALEIEKYLNSNKD